MRSLQASALAGCTAAAVPEVSTTQPASLRCGWKGASLRGRSFSTWLPSRELRTKPVAPRSAFGPPGGGGVLAPQLKEALDKYLSENKVVLFMKGNRMFPQCGFSNTCVQILNSLEVPYETVNILEDENLRQGMKVYSSWPTFPQLYIDGEFFGGCDITLDAYHSGELKELLEKAMLS